MSVSSSTVIEGKCQVHVGDLSTMLQLGECATLSCARLATSRAQRPAAASPEARASVRVYSNKREREDLTTRPTRPRPQRPRPASHEEPARHAAATAQAIPARTRLTLLLFISAYDTHDTRVTICLTSSEANGHMRVISSHLELCLSGFRSNQASHKIYGQTRAFAELFNRLFSVCQGSSGTFLLSWHRSRPLRSLICTRGQC